MSDPSNPLTQWLGLSPDLKNPTFYDLLGVKPGETSGEKIAIAADRAIAKVRASRPGANLDVWADLIDKLLEAKSTLCDPLAKAAYDKKLASGSGIGRSTGPQLSSTIVSSQPTTSAFLYPPGMGPKTVEPTAAPSPKAETPANRPMPVAPTPAAPAPYQQAPAAAPSYPASYPQQPSQPYPSAPAYAQAPMAAPYPQPMGYPQPGYPQQQPQGPGYPPAGNYPQATYAQPTGYPQAYPSGYAPAPYVAMPVADGGYGYGGHPMPPPPPSHQPAAVDPMAPVAIPGMSGANPMAPMAVATAIPMGSVPTGSLPTGSIPTGSLPQGTAMLSGKGVEVADPSLASGMSASRNSASIFAMKQQKQSQKMMLIAGAVGAIAAIMVLIVLANSGSDEPLANNGPTTPTPTTPNIPATTVPPVVAPPLPPAAVSPAPAVVSPTPVPPAVTPVAPVPITTPTTPGTLPPAAIPVTTPPAPAVPGTTPPAMTPMPSDPAMPAPATPTDPTMTPPAATPTTPEVPAPTDPSTPAPGTPTTPVPTPVPTPEPMPEMPAVSAAELAKLSKAVEEARVALGEHAFDEAAVHLEQAKALAKLPEHQDKVARLALLANYSKQFRSALVDAATKMQAGEAFTVGTSTQVVIVETLPDKLIVRIAGQNRTFPYGELPLGLATAIADFSLDASDPVSRIVKGAYVLLDKRSTTENIAKARTWWEEAQLGGADLTDLMPALTEKYEFTAPGVPAAPTKPSVSEDLPF